MNASAGACWPRLFSSSTMNELRSRPFLVALLLSLGVHLLIFLPWRYGNFLAPGLLHGRISPQDSIRLDVLLVPKPSTAAPAIIDASGHAEQAPPTEAAKQPVPAQPPTEAASPAGIPFDPLYYYSLKELDQRPVLVRQPVFDDAAAQTKLLANGSAVLELLIEKDGQVNAVNVVRTDLLEVHVSPLRKAFTAVEYTPGMKAAQAVRSRLYIEVSYVDGVISPTSNTFPQERSTHTPLQLPPDWRKPKQNPPPRGD